MMGRIDKKQVGKFDWRRWDKLIIFVFTVLFLFAGCKNSLEDKKWRLIRSQDKWVMYDSFLIAYPNSIYKKEALDKMEELFWVEVKNKNTVYFYLTYLNRFSDGKYAEEATKRIGELPITALSLTELESKRFIGKSEYSPTNNAQMFSLRFKNCRDKDSIITMEASINLGVAHKNTPCFLQKNDMTIHFLEKNSDEFRLGLGVGKIYKTGQELFIETVLTNEYWRIE